MEEEANVTCPDCGTSYSTGETFCPRDGSRLTPAGQHRQASGVHEHESDALVGQTIDERYRVIRRIGTGGMGVVYEARHVTLDKRVALKLLREKFCEDEAIVERFRREARSASKIGHDHIVETTDFGHIPDRGSYFVMEFLEGNDLSDELVSRGPITESRAVEIAFQCAAALAAAHDEGIVHRDMKPANVFLKARKDGSIFVKIVDFGIAKMSDMDNTGLADGKLTSTGMVCGTPDYMAPEQAYGQAVDGRTDIYALGLILHQMIHGNLPKEDAPSRASAPPSAEVSGIITRALALAPADRYQSMEAVSDALAPLRSPSMAAVRASSHPSFVFAPTAQSEPKRSTEEQPPSRPRPRKLSIALALVALGALAAWWLGRAPAPTSPAIEATDAPAAPAVPASRPAAPVEASPVPTVAPIPEPVAEAPAEAAPPAAPSPGNRASEPRKARTSDSRRRAVRTSKPSPRPAATTQPPSQPAGPAPSPPATATVVKPTPPPVTSPPPSAATIPRQPTAAKPKPAAPLSPGPAATVRRKPAPRAKPVIKKKKPAVKKPPKKTLDNMIDGLIDEVDGTPQTR